MSNSNKIKTLVLALLTIVLFTSVSADAAPTKKTITKANSKKIVQKKVESTTAAKVETVSPSPTVSIEPKKAELVPTYITPSSSSPSEPPKAPVGGPATTPDSVEPLD